MHNFLGVHILQSQLCIMLGVKVCENPIASDLNKTTTYNSNHSPYYYCSILINEHVYSRVVGLLELLNLDL